MPNENDRLYHVIFVYETHDGKMPKGSRERMTAKPCTHKEACTFMSKMVPSKLGRYRLEELTTSVKVGDGATHWVWTDRAAATVVEVSADGKTVVIQDDKATRTDNYGMSETQHYSYSPDPEGSKHTFTLRKDGKYWEKGSAMGEGRRIVFGARRTYYDYSF